MTLLPQATRPVAAGLSISKLAQLPTLEKPHGANLSRMERWGMDVAKRRGSKRAKVALARKIGVILHRMWVDGSEFRWGKQAAAPAVAA